MSDAFKSIVQPFLLHLYYLTATKGDGTLTRQKKKPRIWAGKCKGVENRFGQWPLTTLANRGPPSHQPLDNSVIYPQQEPDFLWEALVFISTVSGTYLHNTLPVSNAGS